MFTAALSYLMQFPPRVSTQKISFVTDIFKDALKYNTVTNFLRIVFRLYKLSSAAGSGISQSMIGRRMVAV